MQSIPSVVPQPQPQMKGMMAGQSGQPETESFDFLNYLLGLQGSPTQSVADLLGNPEVATPTKGQTDPSRDPLQAMFAAFPMNGMNPQIPAELSSTPKPEMFSGAPLEKPQATPQDSSQAIDLRSTLLSALSSADRKIETEGAGADEAGISLEGFSKSASEAGIELSVSKKGQEMAAKKYAAQLSQADAPAPTPEPARAQAQTQKSVEVTTSATPPPVFVEKKADEVGGKKSSEGSSLDTFQMVSNAASPRGSEATREAQAAQRSEAASGPVTIPEVMQRVDTLVHRGGGEMTVSLDPPNLGKVEIKVTTQGNRVEVEMRSESHQAKSALEGHFNELKSAMQSQDLHLAKLDVQVHRDPTSFAGQSFSGMADGRNAGNAQSGPNQGQGRFSPESNRRMTVTEPVPQTAVRSASPVRGSSRVDLRI